MANNDIPRVIDGDTVVTPDGRRIRDANSDTPEATTTVQPGGPQATLNARRLIDRDTTFGEKQGETYGREVRDVVLSDGSRLSDRQVGAGLGVPSGFADTQNEIARLGEFAKTTFGDDPTDLSDERLLRQSARRMRAQQLHRVVNSGRAGQEAMIGRTAPIRQDGNYEQAWERGTAELRMMGNAFVQAVGEVTGYDPIERFGAEGVQEAYLDALRNPASIESFDDVESLSDFALYASELVVAEAPSLLTDAALAVATGGSTALAAGVGKAFARRIGGSNLASAAPQVASRAFSRGAKAGAFGSMYAQNTGESYMELLGEGETDATSAFIAGGIKSAMDASALFGIVGDMNKRLKAGESVDSLSDFFMGAIGATAKGVLRESPTEMLQTLTDELNKARVNPDYEINPDALIESAIAGGIVGGTLGGAGGTATGALNYVRGADRAADAEVPAADAELGETTPEPPSDIAAQVRSRPDGVAYVAPSNVKDGETLEAVKREVPEAKVRDLPNGGAYVSTSDEALAAAPEAPTEGDNRDALGYAQDKAEAAADSPVVMVEEDDKGRVVREQVIGTSALPEARRQAVERGAQVRVTTPQEAQRQRKARYDQELAELRAARGDTAAPMRPAARKAPREADRTPLELPSEMSRQMDFGFGPLPINDLIQQAEEKGVDVSRYMQAPTEAVDMEALRTRLMSRLRTPMDSNTDMTLADALGDRRLVDMDEDDLVAVADAVGIKTKPRVLAQVRGSGMSDAKAEERYRHTALSHIVRRFDDFKYGVPEKATAKDKARRATPAILTALAKVDPALANLRRDQFDSSAAYRQAVADATPAPARLRQALAKLDTSELHSVAQALNVEVPKADGIVLEYAKQPKADRAGLLQAIAERKAGHDGFVEAKTRPQTERAAVSDGWEVTETQPYRSAAAAVAVYEALDPAAPAIEQVATYEGHRLPPLQEPQVQALVNEGRKLSGNAILSAMLSSDEATRVDQIKTLRLLAVHDPQQIAQEVVKFVDINDIDLARFERGRADINSRFEEGSDRRASASGVSNTRLQETGEQESSDKMFFDGLLNGARYELAPTDNGFDDFYPAGAVRPDSEAPVHTIRVTSTERTSRLEGRNLLRLQALTDTGVQTYAFDAVELARFKAPRDASTEQLVHNLYTNLTRMMAGPQAKMDNAPHVQSISGNFHIPDGTVIAERNGTPVTFGEAMSYLSAERIKGHETVMMADWLDRTLELQNERARALDILVWRALDAAPLATQAEQDALEAQLVRIQYALGDPNVSRAAYDAAGQVPGREKLPLHRYALTDKELETFDGLGGTNLKTLWKAFNATRFEAGAVRRELTQRTRTSNDTDPRFDEIRKRLREKMPYFEATFEATELYDRHIEVEGMDVASQDGMGSSVYDSGMTVDGESIQDVSSDGTVATHDDDEFSDKRTQEEVAQENYDRGVDAEQRAAHRTISQIAEQTQAKAKAWLEANRPDDAAAAEAAAKAAPKQPRNFPSYQAYREIRPTVTASTGVGIQAIDQIAARVFGANNVMVEGDTSPATRAFVENALDGFRLTNRRVMVQVGKTPGDVAQSLVAKKLLDAHSAEELRQRLEGADSGAYVPLGQFVLIHMPARGKGLSANLRWHHALGHELGHLVYDDYIHALESRPAMRERVLASYQQATGLSAHDEPELFMEWFADQTANEMLALTTEQQPKQGEALTPIMRLARMMKALFDRIQGLLPRFTRYSGFAQFASAIRQGQVSASRGKSPESLADITPAGTVRRYDGNVLTKAKAAGTKAAHRVVQAPPNTLYRSVIARLEHYHKGLAARLFQRSGNDRVGGFTGWQQKTNALRDRYRGSLERSFRSIDPRSFGQKAAGKLRGGDAKVMRQALRDLELGRDTKGARELRTLIDGVVANAKAEGLRSVEHPEGFVPVAIDHAAVDKDRAAFTELLKRAFPGESPKQLNDRINVLLDTDGFSEYAIAPGLPVGAHDTTRTLVDLVGPQTLREMGFLNENSEAVLYHWIDGVAKRTAWEANFGGFTREVANVMDERRRLMGIDDPNGIEALRRGLEKDGRFYDPSGLYKQMVDEITDRHGAQAAREVNDMLDGVMGRKLNNVPPKFRTINDWVTAWTGYTLLLFSGVASIPEIGLPAVRAHGRVGILDGLSGYAEARRFAQDAGMVMSDVAEQVVWQSMGEHYQSTTLNKTSHWFFKLNGTQAVTNISRVMGVSIGIRYLLKSAAVGDAQALEQLGVTAADVRAWDADGRPNWRAGDDSASNAVAAKVEAAINQFMYEGSSMPSRFQNPGWFNNPYLKMFWMIKRFMYAYGEGILLGMLRQGKRQWARSEGLDMPQRVALAALPLAAFMVAVMPLAMVGLELRDWMKGRAGKDLEGWADYADYANGLFSRAGGLGPLEVVTMMKQQADYGASPLGALSPVLGKVLMWQDWGQDNQLSEQEFLSRLRRSLPVFAQSPGAWDEAVNLFR